MKFFTDLKTVAFSGSYNDLSNKPSIPAAVAVKGNAESSYRTGNVNLTPANLGALATNGDSKSNTVTFTSNDVADGSATSWTSVTKLSSGITHATFFQRVSQMFKNVRYLYKLLGTTDISDIDDGTVTGILDSLNSNLGDKVNKTDTIAIAHGGTGATTAVNARNSLLAAHSKFAGTITNASALNITSSNAAYDNTYMLVSIFAGNAVVAIVILNGYRSETSLTALGSNQYVKLYENTAYKIGIIQAIKNSDGTVRTKISMQKADSGYRASVINLGGNNTNFEASWSTS